MDAQNLLGVFSRGNPRLMLHELARGLFRFCLEHRLAIKVEWAPREENSLANDLSNLVIPEDWMLRTPLFR